MSMVGKKIASWAVLSAEWIQPGKELQAYKAMEDFFKPDPEYMDPAVYKEAYEAAKALVQAVEGGQPVDMKHIQMDCGITLRSAKIKMCKDLIDDHLIEAIPSSGERYVRLITDETKTVN